MSLVLNWVIGPAMMTGLAWATLPDLEGYRWVFFVRSVTKYGYWWPSCPCSNDDAVQLLTMYGMCSKPNCDNCRVFSCRTGVILVGIARCIAMVLIWNQLARGSPEYCAVLVAINSVLQIILYAPLALFYLKVVSRSAGDYTFGFWQVARSVLIFLGAPLAAGVITRYGVIAIKGRTWLEKKFLPRFGPVALVALVYTVLVLFALQGERVIHNLGDVVRVAVPLVLYFGVMWVGTVLVARRFGSSYEQAVTQSFTASSNNFELAIAIAVGTFGVKSEAALAATVGPLVEVPVLLGLVYVALWLSHRLKWQAGTSGGSMLYQESPQK